MRRDNYGEKALEWLTTGGMPVTKTLLVANVITFFLAAFRVNILTELLAFNTNTAIQMPWTFVTYPFIGAGGVIGLLFSCYWLWVVGGSLEHSWGSPRFATYLFMLFVITALGFWVGSRLLSGNAYIRLNGIWLAGILLPLSGLTVTWAMLNPEQIILFFMIIPMKLKYLALLDVALVLVSYGGISPLLGIFALAGCAYGYLYVRPRSYRPAPPDRRVVRVHKRSFFSYLNPMNWIRGYRDRKRLRKLFDDTDWGNR